MNYINLALVVEDNAKMIEQIQIQNTEASAKLVDLVQYIMHLLIMAKKIALKELMAPGLYFLMDAI